MNSLFAHRSSDGDAIYDLLSTTPEKQLALREARAGGVFVEGVSWERAVDAAAAVEALARGNARRRVAATALNASSSRSHALFRARLSNGGTLTMVDLAGSERSKRANTDGAALREGAAINASLSALGACVRAAVSSTTQRGARAVMHPKTCFCSDKQCINTSCLSSNVL